MAKRNTSIEINGQRYDALTGKVLTSELKTVSRSIDGVVRPGLVITPSKPVTHAPGTITLQPATTVKPVMDIKRTLAPAAKNDKAKSSATLMRHVVHKPTGSLKSRTKVQTSTLLSPLSAASVKPKHSLYTVDSRRQNRATKVALSQQVSHFATVSTQASPQPAAVTMPQPPTIASHQTEAALQSPPSVFERALATATSHQQPILSKKELRKAKRAHKHSRRLINYSASALAIVLLAGFITYQNMANVTLKVAASKAGFAATLPGYRPSGFAIGKFSYSPGNVAVNFHSNSDQRHFALLEKPSNWDSDTLLSNFVATSSSASYQTVAASGRTVYLYGQNNATWVNDGIWYQIHGNDSLSNQQLTDLASSM